MPSELVTNAFRYIVDVDEAAASFIGTNRFQVWLVQRTFTGVGLPTPQNAGYQRTNYRITVGTAPAFTDGYSVFADTYDGYLDPSFRQVTMREAQLSNNQLTDKDFMLGPLAFPYTMPFASGGFDPTLIDPPVLPGNNLAISLWVIDPTGNSLPDSGIYCKLKYKQDDSPYSYCSYWTNTGSLIPVSSSDIYIYGGNDYPI